MEEDHNSVTLGAGTTTTGGVVFSAIEGSKIIVGSDGMISRDVWFLQGMGMGLWMSMENVQIILKILLLVTMSGSAIEQF